jgi:hypothetical protein
MGVCHRQWVRWYDWIAVAGSRNVTIGDGSDRRAFRNLSPNEECLGIRPLTADLEGPEVLVPIAIRNVGGGLDPEAKLVEIRYADRPVAHPIHKMLAYRDG